jgi:hypothetical protein
LAGDGARALRPPSYLVVEGWVPDDGMSTRRRPPAYSRSCGPTTTTSEVPSATQSCPRRFRRRVGGGRWVGSHRRAGGEHGERVQGAPWAGRRAVRRLLDGHRPPRRGRLPARDNQKRRSNAFDDRTRHGLYAVRRHRPSHHQGRRPDARRIGVGQRQPRHHLHQRSFHCHAKGPVRRHRQKHRRETVTTQGGEPVDEIIFHRVSER